MGPAATGAGRLACKLPKLPVPCRLPKLHTSHPAASGLCREAGRWTGSPSSLDTTALRPGRGRVGGDARARHGAPIEVPPIYPSAAPAEEPQRSRRCSPDVIPPSSPCVSAARITRAAPTHTQGNQGYWVRQMCHARGDRQGSPMSWRVGHRSRKPRCCSRCVRSSRRSRAASRASSRAASAATPGSTVAAAPRSPRACAHARGRRAWPRVHASTGRSAVRGGRARAQAVPPPAHSPPAQRAPAPA